MNRPNDAIVDDQSKSAHNILAEGSEVHLTTRY
jgi:hypothetical protein